MVMCIYLPNYLGSVNSRITVYTSLGIKARAYLKSKAKKSKETKKTGTWLK
jgi:hypothetical protein